MVCHWGMSDVLGPQAFGQNEELMFLGRDVQKTQDYSEETARKIDVEVSRILSEGYERAKRILEENREKLDVIANALLERETIEGYEVEEIVEHGRILTAEERSANRQEESPPEAATSDPGGEHAADSGQPAAKPLQPGLGSPPLESAPGVS